MRDAYAAGMGDPLVTYAQPAPKQEPVATATRSSKHGGIEWSGSEALADALGRFGSDRLVHLYLAPVPAQERKPLFKEFIGWAGKQGYDCANTCNSDTGEWICLNPMTSDLWKAWQAAHGIKEQQ